MATTVSSSTTGYTETTGGDFIVANGTTIDNATGNGFDVNQPGLSGTLVNRGTIGSGEGWGLVIDAATNFTLTNGADGVIRGANGGMHTVGGGSLTITNYGELTNLDEDDGSVALTIKNYGQVDSSLRTGTATNTVTLYTGSSIGGLVGGSGHNDTLTLALDDRPAVATDPVQGANSGSTTGQLAIVARFAQINLTGGQFMIGSSLHPAGAAFGSTTTFNEVISGVGGSQHGELGATNIFKIDSGGQAHFKFTVAPGTVLTAGQTFTILTYGSLQGTFAEGTNVTGSGYDGTLTYGANAITLTITGLHPTAVPATGKGLLFDEATKDQALNFASGDKLIFQSGGPADVQVAYTPAAGLNNALVTLSEGGHSLTFAASALHDSSDAGLVTFLGSNGSLYLAASGGSTYSLNSANASAVYGFDGNDSFTVAGGNHIVDGGAGNDVVTANGTGNMVLAGGAGADTIEASGATGNLHIYGNEQSATQGAVDGNDVIRLQSGSGANGAVTDYVNGNAGDDTISVAINGGGNSGDVFRLYGGAGNDSIVGGDGTNLINGNLGNDTITGHGSNDVLHGGQGNDVITGNASGSFGDATHAAQLSQLFGDAGNDRLVAGSGITVLQGDPTAAGGASGSDVFLFGNGTASAAHVNGSIANDPYAGYVDEIVDFAPGVDKIDLNSVTNSNGANLIVVSPSDVRFDTATAALTYAQGLIGNTAAPVGTHNIVLVQIGRDTFLFSHEGTTSFSTESFHTESAGPTIDTVIKLDGVSATALKASDFV